MLNKIKVYFAVHIGVECNESKSSSTVFGVSWTDGIATVVELVALTDVLLIPGKDFEDESPIGSVNVVVFPPL